MRKIKQTERPYVISYIRGERCLYDSARTLEHARVRVAERLAKNKTETAIIRRYGEVVWNSQVERLDQSTLMGPPSDF